MATFEELKNKGWMNLSKEEKVEYKKYKDAEETATQIMAENEVKVEVSKIQLDGLLARLDQLESEKKNAPKDEGEWEEDDEGFKGNRTAHLRTKDGKYLVDWKYDPQNKVGKIHFNTSTREVEHIYEITLLKEDGTTEKEDFVWKGIVHLPTVEVKLVDQEIKRLKKRVGTTNRARVNWDDYKTTAGGEVPMYVKEDRITFTCELPDGRKIKLDSSRLNS